MAKFPQKLWSLLPYFVIPAAGALSPLLVIPAVSATFGPMGWAAMAVGQSIGAAAGVVGELGWGVVGPQQLSRLNEEDRIKLYRASLASRLLTSLPLALVGALAALAVAPGRPIDAAFLAAGTALSALSTTWFFIGINRPLLILWTESVPKILTALVSGALIFLGLSTAIFGILTVVQVALTLFLASRYIGGAVLPDRSELSRAPTTIRSQLVISVGRSVSVIYTILPTAIGAIVAPGAIPAYAAADRLMRMSLAVLAGIPSRLQSWLGSANGSELTKRRRRTIQINTALGATCGVGFALLAPFVAGIVFAGQVSITPALAWLTGALLTLICASRGLGLVLVSVGGADSITTAIVPSAITGLALLFPFAIGAGAVGIVVAGICAEVTGLVVQAVLYKRRLRG